MAIATLAQAKREMKAKNTISSLDDYDLVENIAVITTRIEKKLGFGFEPRYETRKFTADGSTVNSQRNTIWLKAPILAISSVSSDGSDIAVGSAATVEGEYGGKDGLYLNLADANATWYPATVGAVETVLVTGLFGYRRGYPTNGWQWSRDALVAAINDSTDTLIVTDPNGIDSRGVPPRFSLGNLVRIDDEFMEVIAVDATSVVKTLTVNRGARGSTAAAHLINTRIYTWYPEDDILRVVKRVAGLYYNRKGAFEQMQVSDLATVTFPSDLPAEVYGVLQNYT